MMNGLAQDLRQALRLLGRKPGLTAVVILVLGLGIGTNTTLFSLVDAVVLRPLPFPHPDRLVAVWETNPATSRFREGVASANLADWRVRGELFEGIAGWYVMGRTLRTDRDVEVVSTAQVTVDFFSILGTSPAIGRSFTSEETERADFNNAAGPVGADPVVILSDRIWRRRFDADPGVIGRTVSLERLAFRVVGVMPAGFAFPDAGVDLWIPWNLRNPSRDQHYLRAVARIDPDVPLSRAQEELDVVAAALAGEHPETNEGWGVRLVPMQEDLAGPYRPALLLLFGAVGCVLLICCVNVASLQLARAMERQSEIGIRLAIGASRTRLVRQFVIESLVLSLVGGGVGALLAVWGIDLIKRFRPADLPRLHEVALDAPALLFTLGAALLAGLIFGLAPALEGSRVDLAGILKGDGGRGATAGPRRRRLRRILVISEVALAMVLLTGAGLLVRSYTRLQSVDPGFDPDRVLVLPIFLDSRTYDRGAMTRAYYERLIDRLAALPGVEAVGGATALPASPLGPDFDRPVWREGDPPPPGGSFRADIRMATPGYFNTLGIAVLRGRPLSDRDRPDSERVVVINENLAGRFWPDEDPIGKRLVLDYSTAGTYPYKVVGVVNDVRFYGLRSEPRPEIYIPHAQRSYLIMNIAVRTSGDPATMAASIRRAVLEVDPEQPAQSVVPLRDLLGATHARDRSSMLLLGAFASTSLLLASIGVFGLLSHLVGQRILEIGIRMALGATQPRIVALVLSEGAGLVIAGVALGTAAAIPLTRLLRDLLFEVHPADPVTFLASALLLLGVSLLASWLPARRATRVEVVAALRHD